LSSQTLRVGGPERSGSGTGVPVPSSTTFVRSGPVSNIWLVGCCGAAAVATVITADTKITRMSFMVPIVRESTCAQMRLSTRRASCLSACTRRTHERDGVTLAIVFIRTYFERIQYLCRWYVLSDFVVNRDLRDESQVPAIISGPPTIQNAV